MKLSEVKACAENKLIVSKEMELAFQKEETIVGKGENAGYQHFLLFPTMF